MCKCQCVIKVDIGLMVQSKTIMPQFVLAILDETGWDKEIILYGKTIFSWFIIQFCQEVNYWRRWNTTKRKVRDINRWTILAAEGRSDVGVEEINMHLYHEFSFLFIVLIQVPLLMINYDTLMYHSFVQKLINILNAMRALLNLDFKKLCGWCI